MCIEKTNRNRILLSAIIALTLIVGIVSSQKSSAQSTSYPQLLQEQINKDRDAVPTTNPALPNFCEWTPMPGYEDKMEIRRITQGVPTEPDEWSEMHLYSRRPAFSVDGNYYILGGRVLSTDDCSVVARQRSAGLGSENVASMVNGDLIYGLSGNTLYRWSISTGVKTPIYTAQTGFSNYTIGQWEGRLSHDDRLIVLAWGPDTNKTLEIVDTVTGERVGGFQTGQYYDDFNASSISPLGNFISVAHGDQADTIHRLDGTIVRQTTHTVAGGLGGHSDWMLNEDGHELLVGPVWSFNFYNATTDEIYNTDIIDRDSGVRFAQSHISGLAYGRPGWAYISAEVYHEVPVIYAFNVEPGNREVELWGWHYSHLPNFQTKETPLYQSHAKLAVNRSGTEVMFTSDWGGRTGLRYEFVARPLEGSVVTSTPTPTPPPNNGYDGTINVAQAQFDGGYAWRLMQDFGTPSDSSGQNVSTLRIFENGVELGPAHSVHQHIRDSGNGRFSHWGGQLWFSASDNSNPTTNGRTYTFLRGDSEPPTPTATPTPLPALPPTAPTDLWVQGANANIVLQWLDESNDETGFTIQYRESGSGDYMEFDTIPADAEEDDRERYVIYSVECDISYDFSVRAYNDDGLSAPTNERTVTSPCAPTNLTITPSGTSITLNWLDNSTTNRWTYIYFRPTHEGNYAYLGRVGATATSATYDATNDKLSCGVEYQFRARTLWWTGRYEWLYSPMRNAVRATIPCN